MQRVLKIQRSHETPPNPSAPPSGHTWLFLAAFPILTWGFEGSLRDTGSALLVFGLLIGAVRLLARGDAYAARYEEMPGARAPRFPRRIVGSVLLGIVVMLLAGHHFATLFMPLVFGSLALCLSLVAFGLDPMKDKPIVASALDTHANAEQAVERSDYALAQIADKVAMLEDIELTRRTEAARSYVLRLLRGFARHPDALERCEKSVGKFIRLLDTETERLCRSAAGENSGFARKRFIAKLDVMTETLEKSARAARRRHKQDAFEVEADLLLDRMPQETLA